MAKVVSGARARRSRVSAGPTDEDPIEGLMTNLLLELGEDPDRNGLLNTPKRVAKAMRFMTQGYRQDIDHLLNGALFPIEYDEMVIVKDIDFFSMCEHHLLPFRRVVDVFARRLQVQERLTLQIAETLKKKLNAHGVAVVMEARHLCMMMRGVEKQNTVAVSSSMLGVFRTQQQTREEFLKLIRGSSVRDGN